MTSAAIANHGFSNNHTSLFDGSKEDACFTRILYGLILIFIVFGVIVPFIERVEIAREIKEQVPVQLTRVMLKEKEIKKVTPPPEVKEEEPEPIIDKKPEDKPKPIIKTKREAAKQKAKSSGLAAMKDDLLSLRESFIVKPKANKLIKQETTSVEPVKRNLLAAKANKKSQHIAATQAVTTAESDSLSTHATQTVRLAEEEILASSGNDGLAEEEGNAALVNVRSEMKLRQTLEANKSRLYSLYNRALRKNPFLKGKVLFEIEIEPSGKVLNVTIQSSELEDKSLERRLMSVLRGIDFGAEDVDLITTVWAIEFLPR